MVLKFIFSHHFKEIWIKELVLEILNNKVIVTFNQHGAPMNIFGAFQFILSTRKTQNLEINCLANSGF